MTKKLLFAIIVTLCLFLQTADAGWGGGWMGAGGSKLALQPRNTDTVEVGGYEALVEAAATPFSHLVAWSDQQISLYAGTSIYTNESRVKQIKVYWHAAANMTSFTVSSWYLGANGAADAVRRDSIAVGNITTAGATPKTIDIPSPYLPVKIGDFIGLSFAGAFNLNNDFTLFPAATHTNSAKQMLAKSTGKTSTSGLAAAYDPSLNAHPIKCYGQAPNIIHIGNSLVSAVADNCWTFAPIDSWTSAMDEPYDETVTAIYWVAKQFGWVYQRLGVGGEGSAGTWGITGSADTDRITTSLTSSIANGSLVTFSGAALPAPLSANTTIYYVKQESSTTYSVYTNADLAVGHKVDLTTTGSGDQSMHVVGGYAPTVLARFTAQVVDHKPNYVIITYGGLSTDRCTPQSITATTAMIHSLIDAAVEADIIPIITNVNYHEDGDDYVDGVDALNVNYKALVDAHPTAIWLDTQTTMCGANKYLNEEYAATGSHFNALGQEAWGKEMARQLQIKLSRNSASMWAKGW